MQKKRCHHLNGEVRNTDLHILSKAISLQLSNYIPQLVRLFMWILKLSFSTSSRSGRTTSCTTKMRTNRRKGAGVQSLRWGQLNIRSHRLVRSAETENGYFLASCLVIHQFTYRRLSVSTSRIEWRSHHRTVEHVPMWFQVAAITQFSVKMSSLWPRFVRSAIAQILVG